MDKLEQLKQKEKELISLNQALNEKQIQLKLDKKQINNSNINQSRNQNKIEDAKNNADTQKDYGYEEEVKDGIQSEQENIYLKQAGIDFKALLLKEEENEQKQEYKSLEETLNELIQIYEEQQKIYNLNKLKLNTVKLDVESLNYEVTKKDALCFELEAQGNSIQNESQRYLTQVKELNQKIASLNDKSQHKQQLIEQEEKDCQALRKKEEEQKKQLSKAQNETNRLQIQINRLQEQFDKLKLDQLDQFQMKGGIKQPTDIKSQNEKLLQSNQMLERQKIELLQGFKKQLQYIDILKRQITHMEAAYLFGYCETEFLKAIDLNQQIFSN